MEESLSMPANESVFCKSCYEKVNEADAFCNNCGYPLKGTEAEQRDFIANRTSQEIDLKDYNKKIKSAGIALYWVAAACLISGLVFYAVSKDDSTKVGVLIVNLILTMIFVFLGAWSKKKPLAAIISGSSLYGILIILNAIADPMSILSGIWVKIIIIAALIKGIKSAIDADRIKKELNL